jgi:hypothetical protein
MKYNTLFLLMIFFSASLCFASGYEEADFTAKKILTTGHYCVSEGDVTVCMYVSPYAITSTEADYYTNLADGSRTIMRCPGFLECTFVNALGTTAPVRLQSDDKFLMQFDDGNWYPWNYWQG